MPVGTVAAGERPRLLLVEDDAPVRRSLQLLLQSRGYDVRAYASGGGLERDPEALRAECLIADLMLREGDALGLLRRLKKAGWCGSAVLISGHLDREVQDRAIGEGYDFRLEKPLADAVMTCWIDRLISIGRLHSSMSGSGTKG